MEVLNRYQKDRNFLKKEANEIKQKGALIMSSDPVEPPKKKQQGPNINPLLLQEERHRIVQEKREQRLKA
jgi:hypothetical protein